MQRVFRDIPHVIVASIAIGAIMFNELVRSTDHTLLTLLVFGMFVVATVFYIRNEDQQKQFHDKKEVTMIEDEGLPAGRREIALSGQKMFPSRFSPKGFKYIVHNDSFMAIVKDIRVLRIFDRAKYGDIIAIFDYLQKIYMYILSGRYDASYYISTFVDVRQTLLEHMYGLVFNLPSNFNHIYGINSDELISNNINKATAVTRMMIEVLKSYAMKTAKKKHIADVAQLPYPIDTTGLTQMYEAILT